MDRPVVRPAVLRDMGPGRHRRPGSSTRLVILIALVALACQPQSDQVPEAMDGVPTVIDGDSLSVSVDGDALEVRLDGINAPESDECLAEEASTRLRQLTDAGIVVEPTGIDQFGRTLALVRSASGDADLLNETMIGDGLAIASSGGDWSERFIAAESEARQAKLGIWNPAACGPAVEAEVRIEFSQPNPPGADRADDEFITLHNEGAEAIDLSGFVLRDESSAHRLRIPVGTSLAPDAALEVWTGCEPRSGIGWCSDTPIWNNGGDSALLLSPAGNVVAHARYDPAS